MSTDETHRSHRTSRDKLAWCLHRRFIGYTGLVVINLSGFFTLTLYAQIMEYAMVFSIRQIGCDPDQLVDGPLQDKDIPLSYIFTSSQRGLIGGVH